MSSITRVQGFRSNKDPDRVRREADGGRPDRRQSAETSGYKTEDRVGMVFLSEAPRRRVHLHQDNEATEERRNGVAVVCPFCGV